MKIIRNYILKDFFILFFFSLLLLSLVMLVGNLMKLSDMVIRQGVDIIDAFKIFLFFVPYLLGFTIPLSFLLAILLVMGRLIVDNEIIAMRVAGISLIKILNLFLIIGVAFSLFLFLLNDRIIPNAHYKYRSQLKNIYFENVSAIIEPGVFLENFENHILYVSDKDGNKLKNVFIYEVNDKEGVTKVTFAKRGEFVVEDEILKIKLEDGFRDETNTGEKQEMYRLNFKVFFTDIPIKEQEEVEISKKPKDMTIRELLKKISHLKEMGIDLSRNETPVELISEFHKRISFSFSIITFIILGFGTSLVVKHRERTINFWIAILAAGIYYLLFVAGEALIEYNFIIPSLGMWLPNIIIGCVGLYFIIKKCA
ncbi:MAG: LptF/LptG family permease [Candidatus Omnitrophica bacterium]|nr:LptF/LptG family permease [Candidatus Omnitrophota bacterium]MBD3269825.1 LptF/LptG family permease [Candidatus Omnitrophota bacterium]